MTTTVVSSSGVIHGWRKYFPTPNIIKSLESWHATILYFRVMGETESVLMKLEGTQVPCNVPFQRVLYR
ncbi:hypothetical protein HPB48_015089 [Haemaphysalis longicornis]|uniref:Uncharacterized protein n=1 Tax=Haemaphysalis longicornis TaxID=44386 RepID=A0A9J6GRF5_HAELO|nr:hypothetical protein HPB48_015089 [Haemaphysalis longicornis]